MKKSKSCEIIKREAEFHERISIKRAFSIYEEMSNSQKILKNFNDISFEIFPRLSKVRSHDKFEILTKSNCIGFLKSLDFVRNNSVIINKFMTFDETEEEKF